MKAAEGNIAYACFGRHEAVAADIDIHPLLIGIFTLEIGVDHSFIAILFGVPFIDRPFLFPGGLIDFSLDTLFQSFCLIELAVV